jgi:hypothetical protein
MSQENVEVVLGDRRPTGSPAEALVGTPAGLRQRAGRWFDSPLFNPMRR